MARHLFLLTAVAVLLGCASAARAQSADDGGAPPAHVSFVDGTATLEREGRVEKSPLNMPLLAGDRLRTADGRLEVLFGDGSTLHLDSRTTVDIESDDLLRLTDGRVRVNILGVGAGREARYRIDSPAGSARLLQPGEYRIELIRSEAEPQLELAVLRGAGEIFTDEGTTAVRAGERAYVSAGLLPSYAYSYNSAAWDSFDRWSESRRDARLGVSAEYLPSDLQTYSPVFDQYGDWQYAQPYGYVWYPRVAAGWRPYYYGRWLPYPRYGWTWVGIDAFSWPTHHYGRWGFSAGGWFWIPARRWAPAWVSWAYAPGYVSWCPLGFDNRAVIGIDLFRVGPGYYSPWRAWTVVSHADFGRPYYVHDRAVRIDRFDARRRPAFTQRASAPLLRRSTIAQGAPSTAGGRDVAVPRGAAPVQYAGNGAYRRNLPAEAGSHNSTQRGINSTQRGVNSTQRDMWLPPSASAEASADRRSLGEGRSGGRSATERTPARDTAAPRYVNRGDEIIRSRTARPIPPRGDTAVARPETRQRATPLPDAPARADVPSRADRSALPRTAPRAEPRRDDPRVEPPIMRAPGREYAHERDGYQRAPERASPERAAPRAEPRAEPRPEPSRAARPEPTRPEPSRGAPERAQPRQSGGSAPSAGYRRGRG